MWPFRSSDDDDFAIIGISGCFPGGELEDFWAAVRCGASQIRAAPAGRAHAGSPGGYIDDIDCFDHLFFGLSAAKAALMDPQQRLLLQYSWWALEDAGIPAAQFARSPTGVFIAAAPGEYREIVEPPGGSPYLLTSSAPCMLANRISYLLDLRGPSEFCNTACSSALVAVHRAMQAIRGGECRQSLVGAVNLLLSPDETAAYRQMGFLSARHRARPFQTGADGYVRSEGVGVVLLKPLADAERDGDRIYLKIKGSGVAHGGRGASQVAPNREGIKAAMLAAFRSAGVEPDSVSYLEAHGVGSSRGDATEIAAIQAARAALSGDVPHGAPWTVGSLKPVIGHCELASGMAALFRVIDAMRTRRLPGIPGYQQLSPAIALDERQLRLDAESGPWPALKDAGGVELPRRAGINSYGFGGVNAHLVVEEYPGARRVTQDDIGPQLILLSARDTERLRAQATRLSHFIGQRPDLRLADIAYTLQVGRTAMPCRWTTVVDSIAALRHELDRSWADDISRVDRRAVAIESLPVAVVEKICQALALRDLPALAGYWRQGIEPDWRQLPLLGDAQRIRLPGYAFARTRHWLPPKRACAARQGSEAQSFRRILSSVLGCEPAALAGAEARSLASLGLSSLGAVGLKARLESLLQRSVALAELSPYLSLGEVESGLAAPVDPCRHQLAPRLLATPDDPRLPFALNDLQQSFLSGRALLPENERVGCHLYLEFDWRDLDVYRLSHGWNRLLGRHEALRIRLLDDGRQQIGASMTYRCKIRDLRRSDAEGRERALAAIRATMSHKVYLPGPEPLFEVRVSLLDRQYSRVHLSIDELIVDATSLDLLLQQWRMLYLDPGAALPDPGLSFRDYQLALDAFKSSPRYQRDLQYWVDKLAQAPAGLSLPRAARPAGRLRRRLAATLTPDRWLRLKQQGDALRVSGTAILLTAFGLILRQANAGKAFSLISTFYGRQPVHPGVDRLVGPLISTHLFAFDPARESSLTEVAQRVQHQLLDDMDHLSVSVVAVLREIRRRGGRQMSAGEVVFTSMLNNPVLDGADSFGDAAGYCVSQTPQINLDHQLRERDGALCFSWDAAIDCYPDGMIDQLFADYCHLLGSLADGAAYWRGVSISDLALAGGGLSPGDASNTPFALTDQQQAYAFSRSLHPGRGGASLYLALAIEDLDIPRLARAWQQLGTYHPMLRARILPNGTQQIMDAAPSLRVKLRAPDVDADTVADEMLGRATAPDDWPYVELSVSPPGLVHLAVDLLIADLPSRDLLVRQLLDLYHDRPLAPQSISFAGFMQTREACRHTPVAQIAARYWQEKFSRLPPGPQLDEDDDAYPADACECRLDCWPALRDRIARAGLSADALLICAYAWSLAGHGCKLPFTLVAPGWNRPAGHPEIDALVGDFTTLSWIGFNDQAMTVIERVRYCERILAQDQQHSAISGLQALRKMAADKHRSRKLSFPVVFTRLNPQGPLDLPVGARLVKVASRTHGVALDNLSIEDRNGLLIHWDLAVDHRARARVGAMFDDYCRLLQALAVDDGLWAMREDRVVTASGAFA